jgi:F0F1-type ATP synthase epsilon subunit
MALPRPASPRALIADIRAFAQERSKVQWIAALVAILMPIMLIAVFIKDGKTNIAPGEQIIFVDSWSANRTDAEIKAAQAKHQEQREAAAAERQRQFKEVERRFGMDGK